MIEIKLLEKSYEKKYEHYLHQSPYTLYYYSLSYRDLLKKYLRTKDYYLLAMENDEIKGVLPSFISANMGKGRVLNSLPFFGSNGGFIEHQNNSSIRRLLLSGFLKLMNDNKCLTATVITSPFEKDQTEYIEKIGKDNTDSRIGQITPLPSFSNNLIGLFEETRARNIRKAIKSGISWKFSHDKDDIDSLFNIHKENIRKIGGISKKKRFFDLVHEIVPKSEYTVVVGMHKGKKIAALLLFYYNKTVEYFTPAIVEEFRSLQPLSLLIYEAMKDAIAKRFKYWNWGGTWTTQKGVYDFKKRWGTKEFIYYYYTKVNDEEVYNYSRDQLLAYFPFFYVLPFNKLNSNV